MVDVPSWQMADSVPAAGRPFGFHFGTQPSITQEHLPSPTVRWKSAESFCWMLLGHAGCKMPRIENPRSESFTKEHNTH
jgi:hypothetical protein